MAASPKRGSAVRRAAVRWGPAIACAALVFALSAQPGLKVSDDPMVDAPIRHVAHMLIFALLAVLLLRGLAWGSRQPWTWRHAAVAVLLATLYGVTDEIHQTYVPERTGHLVDVGWDLVGAGAGVLVVWLAAKRWPRLASVVTWPD